MKLVLAFLTILMGATASATVYDTNFAPGVNEGALSICEGLSSYNRNNCLQTIIGKQFSNAGLRACSTVDTYSDVNSILCLKTIANNAYQVEAAEFCQSLNSFNKISCLKSVANMRFIPDAVATCETTSIYNEPSRINCIKSVAEKNFSPSALKFCRNLSDFNKIKCLESSAGNYYQDSALEVCSSISAYNETSQLSCMKVTMNKIYDTRLLNFCASENDYNIEKCLTSIGGTANSLPSFSNRPQRTNLDILFEALEHIINNSVTAPKPSVPAVNTCLAREQEGKVKSQVVETALFYQKSKSTAIETGKCVVARMANTDRSSTLFDASGKQRIKNASYKEIDELKRSSSDLKGKGCYQFICDDAK